MASWTQPDTKKAKRRIKRFIKTGKPQARVSVTSNENVFEYKTRHHIISHFFKRDRLGRLRMTSAPKAD